MFDCLVADIHTASRSKPPARIGAGKLVNVAVAGVVCIDGCINQKLLGCHEEDQKAPCALRAGRKRRQPGSSVKKCSVSEGNTEGCLV